MPRVDSFSRFSEPPAPPPQQPLPEKPDAPPRSNSDAFSPLKRSDTEKTKPTSSPVSRDSSQILNLIEALSTAKREIDSQGARVKELENLYLQEKAARESAEEKVKQLEIQATSEIKEIKSEDDETETKTETDGAHEETDSETTQLSNGSVISPETPVSSTADQAEPAPAVDTEQLESRLENMLQKMEDMKEQMASFKDRAEKAEKESTESRASLAEMIETLRQERAEKEAALASAAKSAAQTHESSKSVVADEAAHPAGNGSVTPGNKSGAAVQNFDQASPDKQAADSAVADMATEWRRRKLVQESSPYASMFGVVLIGVGIMAYLNGWQKLDK